MDRRQEFHPTTHQRKPDRLRTQQTIFELDRLRFRQPGMTAFKLLEAVIYECLL